MAQSFHLVAAAGFSTLTVSIRGRFEAIFLYRVHHSPRAPAFKAGAHREKPGMLAGFIVSTFHCKRCEKKLVATQPIVE